MRGDIRLRSVLISVGFLALFSICFAAFLCHDALALVGASEEAFGLDGSIRTLFFLLDQDGTYPFSGLNSFDGLSQTIIRLTATGKPLKSLGYEVHLLQSTTLSTQSLSGNNPLTLGNDAALNGVSRYRVLNGSWNVLDSNREISTTSFDRFNLKMSLNWGDITVGRQAITFGKTYFWNPLDVFFPFGASQFDRDYKPGIDALRVDIPLGRFSGVNLVGAAGPRIRIGARDEGGNDPKDASWYGSALLGRVFGNVHGWDFSLQGGKVYGGWQAGAGAVGDVGPVQVRCELAQFLAMPGDQLLKPLSGDLFEDHFLMVFGLGHRFENTLSLDFEYFYNGAGDPNNLNGALARTELGSSLQLSRNLAGLAARYEFSPLVAGSLSVISSLSDWSTQLQPFLTISLSNEMDFLIGMTLNFGSSPKKNPDGALIVQSEFGTAPDMLFMEWKYYF